MKTLLFVSIFTNIFSCINSESSQMETNFNENHILSKIDQEICDLGYFYFAPINANFDYLGGRIHVFWDDSNWLICFELVTFSVRDGLGNDLLLFGEGDKVEPLFTQNNYYGNEILKNIELDSLFDENLYLKSNIEKIRIKDRIVDLPDINEIKNELNSKCPNYKMDSLIYKEDLFRYLIDIYPDIFYMSEKTIYETLNMDIPQRITINEWHFEEFNCYDGPSGIPPSKNEMVIIIAKMIQYKDINFYKPDRNPNIHWCNWINYY